MPSTGPTAKAALKSMLTSAYATAHPRVLVSYGHPGSTVAEDIVAVTTVTAEQETATMRVGARPREERLRLTVVMSCYRGGTGQQAVTEQAFTLLAALEDALADDPTIGGTVRWAAVESYDLAEADDPDLMAAGRIAEISAVIAADARITPTP